MNDIDLFRFLIALLIAVIGFIMGWNLSVRRFIRRRRRLEQYITKLESEVRSFNREREEDPQRAWTDVGTQYVVNQIEQLCQSIREEVSGRRERKREVS